MLSELPVQQLPLLLFLVSQSSVTRLDRTHFYIPTASWPMEHPGHSNLSSATTELRWLWLYNPLDSAFDPLPRAIVW